MSVLLRVAGALAVACAGLGAGTYPLRVGSDHRHLVDQSGTPFLVHGDTAWSLISGTTSEEAERYLDNRQRKGFNAIIVNLIEHQFHGPVNRYGEGPFTTPGDFSTPNEKYFARADRVIRQASDKGIQVFLAPVYLGYPGTKEGWIEEVLANGVEKCRAWGRYVGQRYRRFDNIVWLMGGDRNPGEALAHVNAVAAGIKEADGKHLFTAHCLPEASPAEQYGQGGWLDVNTTYSYSIVHRKLAEGYASVPVKPFVLIESTYEGEHGASAVQIRRQAYWAVLSGAAGQFVGNRPVWLFDPGWEAAMDSVASLDMVRLKAVFQSRPWNRLVPDTKHETVVDGLGEFNGLDTVIAARTADGGTVMAYLPSARTVTVDMTRLRGRAVKAWWFDPRSGKSAAAGEFPGRGRRRFTPVSEGDWVLVLDDASAALEAPDEGTAGR